MNRVSTRRSRVSPVVLGCLLAACPVLAQIEPGTSTDPNPPPGGSGDAPLSQFMTVTLRGDYVAKGIGLDGKSEATIVVDEIPDDARLVGAVLYWAFVDAAATPGQGSIKINGGVVRGRRLGSTNGCWLGRSTFAYRGVVSRSRLLDTDFDPFGGVVPPQPSGNGTYVLSGFPHEEPTQPQGATLVLVYEHESMRTRDVVFTDGNQMPAWSPPPPYLYDTRVPITGFVAEGPVEADCTWIVGNGSRRARDQAFFQNARGRPRFLLGHVFDSTDGLWWDTESLDLDGWIAPGERTGNAGVRIVATPVGGGLYSFDCLIWTAHVLSVTSSNPPDPDPAAHFQSLMASAP